MSLFHRVRGRFPGFQATADVDPHEWRLPSYSYASPSSPKSPTNKALKRASTGFIIGGGGSNSEEDALVTGYRAALYFAVGICAVALVLDFAFVRLVHDNREGWEDPADADPADEDVVAPAAATGTELRPFPSQVEQR